VTLGGAMVVSMNKQNENTQRMGKKHAEAPEFWLRRCAMYNNSLVGRKWMSSLRG